MQVKWQSFSDALRSSRNRYIFSFLAATLIILISSYFMSFKEIALAVDGKEQKIYTRAATVADFLASQKIAYSPHDNVKPDPATVLVPGTKIVVKHAVPVIVEINESRRVIMPVASNVNQVLNQIGIDPKSDVRISPVGVQKLYAGMTINVKILDRRLEIIESPVAYETKRVDDPSLLKGTTKIATKGEEGLKRQEIEHVWAGKNEIEKNVKLDSVVKSPVAEVIKVGTKVPQLAAAPVVQPSPPAFNGNVSRGERTMNMVATGYATGDGGGAGSRTATGTGVYKGIVAVDPRVIPLGTRLLIDGYGPAVAADTGGAIKGNRIDLAFNSVAEANGWGRRPVVVHLLP